VMLELWLREWSSQSAQPSHPSELLLRAAERTGWLSPYIIWNTPCRFKSAIISWNRFDHGSQTRESTAKPTVGSCLRLRGNALWS